MYSDEELVALYPSDYYAYLEHSRPNRWKELVQRLLGYRMGTKDPRFESPGTMLDLGCGSGWFLETMHGRGWVTQGVEINESAAQLGRDSKGLKIFGGTLQQATLPSECFDYVRSNHSFEHLTCPNNTLDEIHRILKPQGKLLIGVPNIDSLSARLFKQYWWYLTVPVHPFSYSTKTLSRMLTKHNFRVERTCFNSDYHGLLGSLQIWLNRNNGKTSAEGMTFNNYVFRLICQWIANLIDLLGSGDCIEITAVKL
jgi:SAM-dependent methyltransferase